MGVLSDKFKLLKGNKPPDPLMENVPLSKLPTSQISQSIRLPYPPDAGLMTIREGDIIMTRVMFDFLIATIYVMPGLTNEELRALTNQLVTDLKELVK